MFVVDQDTRATTSWNCFFLPHDHDRTSARARLGASILGPSGVVGGLTKRISKLSLLVLSEVCRSPLVAALAPERLSTSSQTASATLDTNLARSTARVRLRAYPDARLYSTLLSLPAAGGEPQRCGTVVPIRVIVDSRISPYPAAPLRRFTPPLHSDNVNFSSSLHSQGSSRH